MSKRGQFWVKFNKSGTDFETDGQNNPLNNLKLYCCRSDFPVATSRGLETPLTKTEVYPVRNLSLVELRRRPFISFIKSTRNSSAVSGISNWVYPRHIFFLFLAPGVWRKALGVIQKGGYLQKYTFPFLTAEEVPAETSLMKAMQRIETLRYGKNFITIINSARVMSSDFLSNKEGTGFKIFVKYGGPNERSQNDWFSGNSYICHYTCCTIGRST